MKWLARLLLNHQQLRWLAALALACLSIPFAARVVNVHRLVASSIPGAVISLAGFAMAGAAILVAMRGHGRLGELAQESPDAWTNTLEQFFRAARYSIFAAIYFLLSSSLPHALERWQLLSISVTSVFVMTLTLYQVMLAVATLEAASRHNNSASRSQAPEAPGSPPPQRYEWSGLSEPLVHEADRANSKQREGESG